MTIDRSIKVFGSLPAVALTIVTALFTLSTYSDYSRLASLSDTVATTQASDALATALDNEEQLACLDAASGHGYAQINTMLTAQYTTTDNALQALESRLASAPLALRHQLSDLAKNLAASRSKVSASSLADIRTMYDAMRADLSPWTATFARSDEPKLQTAAVLHAAVSQMIDSQNQTTLSLMPAIADKSPLTQEQIGDLASESGASITTLLAALESHSDATLWNSLKQQVSDPKYTAVTAKNRAMLQALIAGAIQNGGLPADHPALGEWHDGRAEARSSLQQIRTTLLAQTGLALRDEGRSLIMRLAFGGTALLFLVIFMIRANRTAAGMKLLNDKITSLSQKIAAINGNRQRPRTLDEAIDTLDGGIEQIVSDKIATDAASKTKTIFLSKMSHDVRTTMNGMLGFLELLQVTSLDERQKEFLNVVNKNTQSLLQIINSIFTASKNDYTQIELETSVFSPLSEIEETVSVFTQKAKDRGISLVLSIDCDLPQSASGDVLKIREIFINLINTALDQTNPGETMVLEVKNLHANHPNTLFLHIGITHPYANNDNEAVYQWAPFLTKRETQEEGYRLSDYIYLITTRYLDMMGASLFIEKQSFNGHPTIIASYTLKLDITDSKPAMAHHSFKGVHLGFSGLETQPLQISAFEHYMGYFGVKLIPIPSFDLLKTKYLPEKLLDGLIFFVNGHNRPSIEALGSLPVPVIVGSETPADAQSIIHDAMISFPLLPSQMFEALSLVKQRSLDASARAARETFSTAGEPVISAEPVSPPAETVSTPAPVLPAVSRTEHKILVVEDNPINQRLAKMILEEAGCTVFVASNGLEGVTAYKHDPSYDIIFMDIQMPVMDGIEATQTIITYEQDNGLPHTPIIALTANALKGDRERFMASGMDEYISKPINKPKFLDILSAFLHRSLPTELPDEAGDDTTGGGKTVLLLRSNFVAEKITRSLLDELGYETVTVRQLGELTEKVARQPFLAVLVDTKIDAETPFERVEETLRTVATPVVFIAPAPLTTTLGNAVVLVEPLSRDSLGSALSTVSQPPIKGHE